MAKFLNMSPTISISYIRCYTHLVGEIKVGQLTQLYMAGVEEEEEEGGQAVTG